MVAPATRALVISRAAGCCEYCRLPQWAYAAPFHVDHVLARQHVTNDDPANLALCCPKCNRKKGPNLAGIDPATGAIEPLFNPRQDDWSAHFRWAGVQIRALTARGRATVAVLDLNHPDRLRLRQSLMDEGALAPPG